jgi:poly-D-alanine transfer protein DltD
MAHILARGAFAWIAVMLIVPIVIASVVVACLVYPCVWLSLYEGEKLPDDADGKLNDQDLYNENQLQLARLWELEGR